MDTLTQIKRDISISVLLRTPEQVEFHKNYILILGIYDDLGLEVYSVCSDWETTEGLENLIIKIKSFDLRSRYNSHRNSTRFIKWITPQNLDKIKSYLKNNDFISAKSVVENETLDSGWA
jgi:hypothetical protein